ncbi:MAG: glycosyltransferase family 1 protein [Saprospiraceae bacterium]
MRIGLNGRFLLKDKMEGIGWFCHEVIRRMVKWHPEHEFIIFFDRPYSEDFLFESNVKGVVIGPQARHPLLWYWWFEHSIPKALKKFNIDVFVSMDGFCSLKSVVPQYLVMHDLAYVHYPEQMSLLVRKFYQFYVPKYLIKAKHIFVNSNATGEDIQRQYSISKDNMDICYSGCKEVFKKISSEEILQTRVKYSKSNPYFLFVGALHPRKNVHGLIQAFDLFMDRNKMEFELIIVGRKAWMTKEIESAYNQAKYKDRIVFLEVNDNEELAKITASAFAAIAPSFLEGFGVPVLEALNCEVPVLCSDRFSLPEIAGPGALLFDPDNINSIANAMQSIVEDSQIQERIQLGNLHKTKFTWDLTAEVMCKRIFEMKV